MLLTDKSISKKISISNDSLVNLTNKQLIEPTVADTIVQMLTGLGVRQAFGIGGGAIAPMWEALERSSIEVLNFRHEGGSTFAAIEAYFASGSPVAIFTTTGPGIMNTLIGVAAAKYDGAKLILISACTSEKSKGKWAFQETSLNTMPEEIFTRGKLFHFAQRINSSNELPEIAKQLAIGFSQPDGFVAHISLSSEVQTSNGCHILPNKSKLPLFTPASNTIDQVSKLLSTESFAIWVGFGARNAAKEILQLAELTGAAVMSSPRGKGIFPENHPQYLGVTGFAGHNSVLEYMKSTPPQRILVLGTRLGEFTSFWNPEMIPPKGFIHVDVDPKVPGVAYPKADTFPVIADVKEFLNILLGKLSINRNNSPVPLPAKFQNFTLQEENSNSDKGAVRPQVLMKAIQKIIVEASNAIIIAEAGNSFAWTTHYLKFSKNKRWRVSTGYGAIGHATTGVLGAAIANAGKAVAVVGDGAMLMNNEINTAVQYKIPAVWIVLNDARYNMCYQGNNARGYTSINTKFSANDFVMYARSMGADGICVNKESELETALILAMNSRVPFVIDVIIDHTEQAPIGKRISSLMQQ